MVATDGDVNGITNGNGLTNGSAESKKAHVLFVTLACAGHFGCSVQLLYHLEEKYPGLTVTVWANKERIADLMNLQKKGDLKDLDLRLEEVFGPVPPYPDPIFPARSAITSPKCFEESESSRNKLTAQKDTPGGPTAIVSDQFLQWSKDLADELGVPWYTYFSTGPKFLMNVVERPRLIEAGIHPMTSPNLNDLLEPTVLGLPGVRIRDLAEEIFFFDNFYLELIDRTKRASAILLNTSEELDSLAGTIATARKLWPSTRILPIGPSLQYPGFGKTYASTYSSSDCLQWLDSRPAKSVLYVSFGSLGLVPKDWILELAAGLEASGVPFLWALKESASTDLSELLPPGFVENTKGQGIIETGWVPQTRILAHPSTGGFLSHSGWNSTLESLCAGVPILAWPLAADQPMNARFIVDVAKVGLAVCYFKEQEQDSFEGITRREVKMAVRQLMVEEKGEELRRKAAEMQKLLSAAVAEGGSSYDNLHTLLDELAGVRSTG